MNNKSTTNELTKDELARIFFILVHDFSELFLDEAVKQKKLGVNSMNYMYAIRCIELWAQSNNYATIKNCSSELIKHIDEA